MKAEELMIGDWVTVVADNKLFPEEYAGKTIPCKVMGFDIKPIIQPSFTEKAVGIDLKPQCGMMVRVANNFGFMYFVPERLAPISLTTDILEKNGFDGDREVMQYHFEEDGQKYHFSLRQMYNKDDKPQGYSFFAFGVLTIIDYVHQLQNAIRLCSIKKEIVL